MFESPLEKDPLVDGTVGLDRHGDPIGLELAHADPFVEEHETGPGSAMVRLDPPKRLAEKGYLGIEWMRSEGPGDETDGERDLNTSARHTWDASVVFVGGLLPGDNKDVILDHVKQALTPELIGAAEGLLVAGETNEGLKLGNNPVEILRPSG